MFEKTNPKIIKDSKQVEIPEYLSFKKNNLYIAFGILSEVLREEINDESIFQIESFYIISNRTSKEQIKQIPIKLEPCNLTHSKNIFYKNFNPVWLKNYYCFDKNTYDDLKIYGNYENEYYQALDIRFYTCKNNKNCSSEEKINRILKNAYLQVYMFDSSLDVNNFKKGTKNSFSFYENLFTMSNRLEVKFTYSKNEIYTNKGFIFDKYEKEEFIQINSINTLALVKNDEYFVGILIENSRNYNIYTRNYLDLASVLAKVGGLLSLIRLICESFIMPIVKFCLFRDMINTKYYFDNYDSNENEIKKGEKNEDNNYKNNHDSKNLDINQESKINRINIIKPSNFLNRKKKSFNVCKINVKLFDIIKGILGINFKYFRKKNNIGVKKSIEDIYNLFDIYYLLEKIQEVELIKQFIFDEDQFNYFESIPKFIISNNNNKKEKNEFSNINLFYNKIIKKENKNFIDEKIINNFKIILKK